MSVEAKLREIREHLDRHGCVSREQAEWLIENVARLHAAWLRS